MIELCKGPSGRAGNLGAEGFQRERGALGAKDGQRAEQIPGCSDWHGRLPSVSRAPLDEEGGLGKDHGGGGGFLLEAHEQPKIYVVKTEEGSFILSRAECPSLRKRSGWVA